MSTRAGWTSRTAWVWIGVCLLSCLAGGAVLSAQIWRGGFGLRVPPRYPTPNTFGAGFNFCRLLFTSNRREKMGWRTDYPGADINFSVRLSELTKTRVPRSPDGDPDHVVIQATDDALFQCPFVLIEDGGSAEFSDAEVLRLREYLLKGGFLLAADYWGTAADEQWNEEIGRVLPPDQYPITTVPMTHPMWHTLFDVAEVRQMPSIQFWRRSGGRVSERGADSPTVDVHGIADSHGRYMVIMVHNTDIPDGWEREGEDPQYFYRFSPDAYSVGFDILIYAMTH